MDDQTFTRTVARRAGLPPEEAERIERATLRTLAAGISGGEAQDLPSQLPGPLQDALRPTREEAESFDVEEFVRRVADGTSGVAAVLPTLREALTPGDFDDVASQLPSGYRALVGPAS